MLAFLVEAELEELLITTPEDQGSNPAIGCIHYRTFVYF